MRPAVLFLDTNVLLDMPRPEEYRFSGRQVTLVVIPEVLRELRGLARSRDRGLTGPATQALSAFEALANRRGGTRGVPVPRSTAAFRVLPAAGAGEGSADGPLVARAKAEQTRVPGEMVAVVTRDWGVADRARAERVKSVLLRGRASAAEIERGTAEHDTLLDLDV